ncbi:MAG TPA: alpha-E domain-containing protein [Pyrinomonadaceae bacterium]|nr:alpha-E domain-containing protein [Pyrinomonadaceae bacterium]
MLSRVADSLYWMSRYLERAEHTARLIDVGLNLMLDQTAATAERRWGRLLGSLHAPAQLAGASDAYQITQAMTFDGANETSIVACIASARENLRQVREQISSEMWEQLNRLYLQVRETRLDDIWNVSTHEFFRSVKEGAHLFQGITDATMNHGEGWQFMQVGRYMERAGETATLLDVYTSELIAPEGADAGGPKSYLDWVGLLKACTAFEAYCKVYTADLRPERIAEFLLLNAECPRSVRFAADVMQSAFQSIAEATASRRSSGRVNRLAGRLRASLGFGQIDEIMETGLHAYLNDVRRQCAQIHEAIVQAYVAYAVETALAT